MMDEEWVSLQRLESHLDARIARGDSQWQEAEVLATGAWKLSGTEGTIDLQTAQRVFCRVRTIEDRCNISQD